MWRMWLQRTQKIKKEVEKDNEKVTRNEMVVGKVNQEKNIKEDDKFEPPSRKPNKNEERRMLGKVIEMLIIAGMTNHVYRFNNQIRIQVNGGPTGLSLTGQVADCFMIDWDAKYLKTLEKYGIVPALYSRFKDDILLATKRLKNGSKIVKGNLIIDEEKSLEDESKTGSKITFEILREIA